MTMDATDRLLAYATGQAALLGVLAGVAAGLTLFGPFGGALTHLATAASGPAARLVHRLLQALTVAVPVAYVLVPLVVVGSLVVRGQRLPGRAFVAGALVVVFVGGALAGSLLAAPASGLVEQRGGAPQVAFATDYTERDDGRGVLTVTHDGGDAVRAGRLSVEGTGVAAVPGADQTTAGPWAGEVSGEWAGDPTVVPGDSVTVGVEGACVVRVVYRTEWKATVLEKYTCPDATD